MYYEINVSKKRVRFGNAPQYVHYFATAERSITTTEQLKEILEHFVSIFPEPEYNISISRDDQSKTIIDIDDILPKKYDAILIPITEEQFEAAKDVLIKELEEQEEQIIKSREKAMDWWNLLSPTTKQLHANLKYDGRIHTSLTGREIEKLYNNW